jgi:alanine racemase
MQGRKTWALIQLENLKANYRNIAALAAPAKVCAMVKADAYGHGAIEVARCLEKESVGYLAVALLEEALELKMAGIKTPILILGTASSDDAEIIVEHGFTQSIYTAEIADALSKAAIRLGKKAIVHVKIDTGMNRQGIAYDEAEIYAHLLSSLPGLVVEGAYSHFSEADNPDTSFAGQQMARFQDALEGLKRGSIVPALRHIANSGAILSMPDTFLDMVRPGIILYGLSTGPAVSAPQGFVPVMKVCSKIASIRLIQSGDAVSYGRTFIATKPTRVALLPIGYADGYPRILSNRAEVLVRGIRAPILGRICMDYCMIDVTHIPQASVSDEAVLFGTPDLPVGEIANLASTIDYEITCGISARVPRIFL